MCRLFGKNISYLDFIRLCLETSHENPGRDELGAQERLCLRLFFPWHRERMTRSGDLLSHFKALIAALYWDAL
jgi:hypothetical protein